MRAGAQCWVCRYATVCYRKSMRTTARGPARGHAAHITPQACGFRDARLVIFLHVEAWLVLDALLALDVAHDIVGGILCGLGLGHVGEAMQACAGI